MWSRYPSINPCVPSVRASVVTLSLSFKPSAESHQHNKDRHLQRSKGERHGVSDVLIKRWAQRRRRRPGPLTVANTNTPRNSCESDGNFSGTWVESMGVTSQLPVTLSSCWGLETMNKGSILVDYMYVIYEKNQHMYIFYGRLRLSYDYGLFVNVLFLIVNRCLKTLCKFLSLHNVM